METKEDKIMAGVANVCDGFAAIGERFSARVKTVVARELLIYRGGKIIVAGTVREIQVKSIGAGVYNVTLKELP